MALLYTKASVMREDSGAVVRRLEEDEYDIAITFKEEDGDGEDDVTEVLLTKEEITEAYDLLFNQ
jgi:hypothetical protein